MQRIIGNKMRVPIGLYDLATLYLSKYNNFTYLKMYIWSN